MAMFTTVPGATMARAQDEPQSAAMPIESRRVAVAPITSEIVVDGTLNEPAWHDASPIGELVQREPRPGEPPTQRTEVRLMHDDERLYIGVICHDSEPGAVIGTQMARDAVLDDDDRIEILLDTFHDRRNAFYFSVNPAGALVDGLVIENGTLNREWDAIWNARTQRTTDGWTAEIAIPFKSLRFRAGQTDWGFNFSRTIKRRIEEDRWSGARLDLVFQQVSEAGEITGFDAVSRGIGLDVRPFVAAFRYERRSDGDSDTKGEPGLDLFYGITPDLNFSATINTDFGETEVDARQINLTRFPLFFPEKRTFFLENAGNFTFSNAGVDRRNPTLAVVPFFSRRIGLLRGNEVPIRFGTQLTGKVGSTDIGVLGVQTDDSAITPGRNMLVGRVKQNLLRQSYVGAIFTNGNPEGPADSSTIGGDFHFATSRFLGSDRNFVVDAFGLQSRNEGVADHDAAYGATVAYPNDLFDIGFIWREVEENFRPALGYVPRPNARTLHFTADYSPRPRDFLNVRQMSHELRYTEITRLDNGKVESKRLFTAPVNWRFNSGDRVELNWVPTFERLFVPFEISHGVVLPPGDYQFTRWRLESYSASKRRVEVRATWWLGTYWSGRADEVELFVQYKLPPHFVINLTAQQTLATLPQGKFTARVHTLRANYAFTPFLAWSNLVQYDNNSNNLGLQSRLRWTMRPGNDIFLVFSRGWIREEEDAFRFRPEDMKLAAKMQMTFRF